MEYPEEADVGRTDLWVLPVSSGADSIEFRGLLTGAASTRSDSHSHPGNFVPDRRRCPACRWFETRVFRESAGSGPCLIYNVGMSDVPGEDDRIKWQSARDAYEAVFLMSGTAEETGRRFLSHVVRRALEQSAEYDPEFKAALARWDAGS